MALIIKYSDAIPTDDRKFVVSTDITGDYNINTNEEGYGTPNDDRVDYALMALAYNMNEDIVGNITLESYDPESVEAFTLPISEDGYYKLVIYIVPIADYQSSIPTENDLIASEYETITKNINFLENNKSKLEKLILDKTNIRRQEGQDRNVEELQNCIDILVTEMYAAEIEFCNDNYENYKIIVKGLNVFADEL